MKIFVTLVVLPLVLLAALGLAAYQLVASIPPWLLVAVIVYLLYRWGGRPSRARPVYGPPPRQRVLPPGWAAPAARPPPAPPAQLVVLVVGEPKPAAPSSAPER